MRRFKNILCILAGDSDSKVVLERASALAKANRAHLTVVEVIDKIPPNIKLLKGVLYPEDLQKNIVAEHRKRLEEWAAPWRENIELQTKVLVGILFLEIIREVIGNGCDLVIKAVERGGLLDRLFGSHDMHLLRKCPCPVWLVKLEPPKVYHRILAAVDVDGFYPSEELNTRYLLNLQILEIASSLAMSELAELHVIAVWDTIGESLIKRLPSDISDAQIVTYVEQVRGQNVTNLSGLMRKVAGNIEQDASNPLSPQIHLIKGTPLKEVSALAEGIKADLVVMGTVARAGISGLFMGNTAETILNCIDCSVLAVKPSGFTTPVTLDC